MELFCSFWYLYSFLQDEGPSNNVIGKRERAKLREMERLKKKKIQEILDAQNAAINADMVCESCQQFVAIIGCKI